MYKFLFLICFLLVTKSFAVDTCHQFYQERVDLNKAYKAYDCYLQLVEIDESISESLFLSATRIYNHETDKDKKIKLMSSMLAWMEKKPAIKNYKYWRAVFLTFYSEQKDKGKIIPSEILKNLNEIKQLFNDTNSEDPSCNRFGAARNLGIMYMKMPAVVGGNDGLSKDFLEQAYQGDSQFTLTQLWLAKLNIKIGEPETAKIFLNSIIKIQPNDIDQNWIPETLEDQAEALKLLKTL